MQIKLKGGRNLKQAYRGLGQSSLTPRDGVKLIDVGDFAANQKIYKDSMFKNIATGFKKTRLQIRQKATLGG